MRENIYPLRCMQIKTSSPIHHHQRFSAFWQTKKVSCVFCWFPHFSPTTIEGKSFHILITLLGPVSVSLLSIYIYIAHPRSSLHRLQSCGVNNNKLRAFENNSNHPLTSLSLLCKFNLNPGNKSLFEFTSSRANFAAGIHAIPPCLETEVIKKQCFTVSFLPHKSNSPSSLAVDREYAADMQFR